VVASYTRVFLIVVVKLNNDVWNLFLLYRYFENTPAVLRCMVEKDYEMFDVCHVEHKEYILNGAVVIGHATNIDERQGLVYVGLKGSMGAKG
jgi:uncharacterized protein (DUF1015 family)